MIVVVQSSQWLPASLVPGTIDAPVELVTKYFPDAELGFNGENVPLLATRPLLWVVSFFPAVGLDALGGGAAVSVNTAAMMMPAGANMRRRGDDDDFMWELFSLWPARNETDAKIICAKRI